jgi:hypothetical protein
VNKYLLQSDGTIDFTSYQLTIDRNLSIDSSDNYARNLANANYTGYHRS